MKRDERERVAKANDLVQGPHDVEAGDAGAG